MSSLIVEVCEIKEVKNHPNAEVHSLDVAVVKGWQCIVKRGQYKTGDRVVFFPPDTVLPTEVSDRLGVTSYLHKQRVKAIKLKGEPSYGLVVTPDSPKWAVGDDVAKEYGATKYEPPPPELMGRTGKTTAKYSGTLADHPLFWKYTDMENLRHFPDVIAEGEEVVMTEKIHGTNVRVGIVRNPGDTPGTPGIICAGSKNHRRKMPMKLVKATPLTGRFAMLRNAWAWLMNGCKPVMMEVPDEAGIKASWFWHPWSYESVRNMLHDLSNNGHAQVELFGEVYGAGVQTLLYGTKEGLAFRAFDLIVDGTWVDYEVLLHTCSKYGVPTAPLAYRGPFSIAKAKEVSEGQTLVSSEKQMREGVVVKPVKERHDHKIGRVILKYVGDEYLQAKEPDKKGNVKVSDFAEQ